MVAIKEMIPSMRKRGMPMNSEYALKMDSETTIPPAQIPKKITPPPKEHSADRRRD
jgi:hypothetical protein